MNMLVFQLVEAILAVPMRYAQRTAVQDVKAMQIAQAEALATIHVIALLRHAEILMTRILTVAVLGFILLADIAVLKIIFGMV